MTHHVTERRSRSLTRSFSDKFVDGPVSGYRPLSLSALSNHDRVKPIKPRLTHSVSENHIGKLASKVKKIKEAKRKIQGKDNYKENCVTHESLPPQIVCPGTKLFTKHRKLSKQNTYVKDINRINRPLPNPHEQEKRTINKFTESLKKYRKLKNRPLPNPNENFENCSDDDDNHTFSKCKYKENDCDGIEYSRVTDNFSPPPESILDLESEEEDAENLYSEIDEYMCTRNEIDLSDEELDSATYSNETSSSQDDSIDTKTRRSREKLLKFHRSSFEVTALVHNRNNERKLPEDLIGDHYATLTINDDEDDETELDEEFITKLSTKNETSGGRTVSRRPNCTDDGDVPRDTLSISGSLCDSLEDIPTLPAMKISPGELKTCILNDGTIRKKYLTRQRANHYETLDEAKQAAKELESPKSITENSSTDVSELKCDCKSKSATNHSPYSSMITMIGTEENDKKTSIAITKVINSKFAAQPKLTSSISLANLAEVKDDDKSIKMRGNTILIKVLDECPSSSDNFAQQKTRNGSLLQKSCSISSINILLEDEIDDVSVSQSDLTVIGHDSAREYNFPLHQRYPSMVTISEFPLSYVENKEVTYYNEARINIGLSNSDCSNGQGIAQEVEDHETTPAVARRSNSYDSAVGSLDNSNNEIIISCGDENAALIRREVDSKSLDSGNASDEIEDSENSFDADSLIDENELTECETVLMECSQYFENNVAAQDISVPQDGNLTGSLSERLYSNQDIFCSPEDVGRKQGDFSEHLGENIAMEPILEEDSEDSIDYLVDDQFDTLSAITEEPETPRSDCSNNCYENCYENNYIDDNLSGIITDFNDSSNDSNEDYVNTQELAFDSDHSTIKPAHDKKLSSTSLILSPRIARPSVAQLPIDLDPKDSSSNANFTENVKRSEYVPLVKLDTAVTPLLPVQPAVKSLVFFNSDSKTNVEINADNDHVDIPNTYVSTCSISRLAPDVPMESIKSFYNSPIADTSESNKSNNLGRSPNNQLILSPSVLSCSSSLSNYTQVDNSSSSETYSTVSSFVSREGKDEKLQSKILDSSEDEGRTSDKSDNSSVLSVTDSGICFIQIK